MEHGLMRQAFERASADRICHMYTLLGPAGIGKSRLAAEFVRGVEPDATVLSGRCLPYGTDITYWPIAEIVRGAADVADGDPPGVVRDKLAALLEGEPEGSRVAEHLGAVLGFPGAATTPEETAWAVRKLFEALAGARPLVAIFDDIHWADRTLLELVRRVAGAVRGAPILLVCLARSQFADEHPNWGGGRLNSTITLLDRLSDKECEDLIDGILGRGLIDERIRDQIVAAAEGNPLFLIEMISMLVDEGRIRREPTGWSLVGDVTDVPIPPTVEAVLGARLDRLTAEERITIERAAIVGQEFPEEAVRELTPDTLRPRTPELLAGLVRRELVIDVGNQVPATYRFHHLLVRDVTYGGMPIGVRARLHEAFASWLERTTADRLAEIEEIVGYHLESAHRYQVELGTPAEELASLGARAAEHLAVSGRRSFARDNMRASASLLARAVPLLPEDHLLLAPSLRELGVALGELGEWARAEAALARAIQVAEASGDHEEMWLARLELADVRAYHDPEVSSNYVLACAEEAIEALAPSGGPGLARAWRLKGDALSAAGRQGLAQQAFLLGAEVAEEAGDERELRARAARGIALGPAPVEEAIPFVEDHIARLEPRPGMALGHLAYLYAMVGRRDETMALIARGQDEIRDLGSDLLFASFLMYAGASMMLIGDVVEAERTLAPGVAML